LGCGACNIANWILTVANVESGLVRDCQSPSKQNISDISMEKGSRVGRLILSASVILQVCMVKSQKTCWVLMVWLPPFHLARSEIDPSRSSNDKEWHVSIRWHSKPKKGVVCFVKMWVAPPFFRSRFVLVPKRDITRLPTKATRPLGTHFFKCAFSRCLQEQSLPVFSGNDCRRWGLLFFHVFPIFRTQGFFSTFSCTQWPQEKQG
jgi:hypothetical protein